MDKQFKIKLYTISPIHIGCDDAYDPTSFVIDETKNKLIEFDPFSFIKSLSQQDRDEFSKICSEGKISSILKIYKFLNNRTHLIKGREVEIASGLIDNYKQVLNLSTNDEDKIKENLNKFVINKTAYNPLTNSPYIPGSSIKGALRTAYLTKLALEKKVKKYSGNPKELEEELLGGRFSTDPFRLVKVSDFLPAGEVKTKIVYALNKKKKESKFNARGVPQILETIKKGFAFEGTILIQKPHSKSGIKKPINLEELLSSANNFFSKLMEKENKILKEIKAVTFEETENKLKSHLGKDMFLLKIGRHSGAEAVTIEENRKIKIMQKKGQPPNFLDHSTTFWLSSESKNPKDNSSLTPFSWVVLEKLN